MRLCCGGFGVDPPLPDRLDCCEVGRGVKAPKASRGEFEFDDEGGFGIIGLVTEEETVGVPAFVRLEILVEEFHAAFARALIKSDCCLAVNIDVDFATGVFRPFVVPDALEHADDGLLDDRGVIK